MFYNDVCVTTDALAEFISKDDTFEAIVSEVGNIVREGYSSKDYHPLTIEQIVSERIPSVRPLGRYPYLECSEVENVRRGRAGLVRLKSIPVGQRSQKSQEWLRYRHDHINASEASQVFTKSRNALLARKSSPFIGGAEGGGSNATAHGNRYERVVQMVREARCGKAIHEFESIEHSRLPWLAASPDGVDDDGVMIEIKNPITREIVGVPKGEYWIQTQIQMEVCDLDVCDFIEAKVSEYDGREFYEEDESVDVLYRGCIVEYDNLITGERVRRYSPLNCRGEALDAWLVETKAGCEGEMCDSYEFWWRMTVYSEFRVYRDRFWFQSVLGEFERFWQEVEAHRTNGTATEIKVKKRVKRANDAPLQPSQCFLLDEDY